MPECGAKLRKKDQHCRRSAMANGRCRLHGGLSTGAKNPTISNRKHGIYDDVLSDEDREFLDTVKLGQVDEELNIVRVQLRRALKLKKMFDANPFDPKLAHVVKIVQESRPLVRDGRPVLNDLGDPVYVSVEVSREFGVPNFDDRVHRWMSRIESLEKTRKELGGGSATPEQTAQDIKTALDELDETVPDGPDASVD